MKKIIITAIFLSSFQLVFSQLGDAYHAPNTLQLSLDRQRRMNAADNAHYDNMRSSNKSASSSSSAGISGDYNAYGWADYSGMRRQEAAGRAIEARNKAYQAKVDKLEALIKARGLKRQPQYHAQLVKAAKEAGYDDINISVMFGFSEKSYEGILVKNQLAENGSPYIGSTKLSCQGDCEETLTANNNIVYTGNTLNGMPHGKGTYKTKATNIEAEGTFANGQMDGVINAKGENYTATGTFKMGKPVGIHTIITQEENNISGNYIMNYDNLNDCSYSSSDGMTFKGKMDATCSFIKGEVVYGSGIKFNGYFKDNGPYRGNWIKEHRIMVGEFGTSNDGTLYLKYGYLDNQKEKKITQGFFAPGMKRTGFQNIESADGTVTEYYYSAPDVEEYICIYFPSGTKLYLKARADGDNYIGIKNLKDDPNNSYPIRYIKNNGIENLAASETELIAKAHSMLKKQLLK
ncbi:MAG: hypothetical protein IPP48_15800 [Chitinophagaceae bacterium]|nr:hypothetical protein [Chitinophagaceae bacterium]